jgi:hypothetical protein
VYKQHPRNRITYQKNAINEYMLILEKFRNKYHEIWITVDGENMIQNLIAD